MGSFALGYLLGMTFSDTSIPANGYTMDRSDRDMTSEEWAKICADDDKSKGLITSKKEWKAAYEKYLKESKDSKEESYWNAWDREFKRGAIERLRTEKDINWLTLDKKPIYPNMSQEEQANLIESGGLYIVNFMGTSLMTLLWTDENREEAKNPRYIELVEKVKETMGKMEYRIVK